jgi:hypothetical protein
MFLATYEIASVVSLPRNDITTLSHKREIRKDLYLIPECPSGAGMTVRLFERSTNYMYCQMLKIARIS